MIKKYILFHLSLPLDAPSNFRFTFHILKIYFVLPCGALPTSLFFFLKILVSHCLSHFISINFIIIIQPRFNLLTSLYTFSPLKIEKNNMKDTSFRAELSHRTKCVFFIIYASFKSECISPKFVRSFLDGKLGNHPQIQYKFRSMYNPIPAHFFKQIYTDYKLFFFRVIYK